MIALQSIPAIVLASITLYMGVYHLLLSYRRRRKQTDLAFALTCLAMGAYDIFCAGLYSSSTVGAGMMWQRRQMLALAMVGISFIWFFAAYTQVVSLRFRLAGTVYFAVMALTLILAPDAVFRPERSLLHTFRFLGSAVSYREAEFSALARVS